MEDRANQSIIQIWLNQVSIERKSLLYCPFFLQGQDHKNQGHGEDDTESSVASTNMVKIDEKDSARSNVEAMETWWKVFSIIMFAFAKTDSWASDVPKELKVMWYFR